jgi:hypothetical protein
MSLKTCFFIESIDPPRVVRQSIRDRLHPARQQHPRRPQAGAKVKIGRGGVESWRGKVLNRGMEKIQRGTLRRLVVGLLLIWALTLAACSDEPSFTEAEKTNARYVTLAFREAQQAVRISNSEPAFSMVSAEDRNRMTMHYQNALKFAETVTDEVLDKVHPKIRGHWRAELEEGIRLRLVNFQEGNMQAEIKGSTLLDRFGDWWNANKPDIKVPK